MRLATIVIEENIELQGAEFPPIQPTDDMEDSELRFENSMALSMKRGKEARKMLYGQPLRIRV